jgi:superfamily II DNA or RNA helicase
MKHMRIRIYSHHFVVDQLSYHGKNACIAMKNTTVQWGMVPERGGMVRKPLREFCTTNEPKTEWRFHINHLEKFKTILLKFSIHENLIDVAKVELYTPTKTELVIRDGWVSHDYQIPIIEYLIREVPLNKFLSLQTGKGKSYCAARAVSMLGARFVVLVRSGYVSKWVEDLERMFWFGRKEMTIIQGSDALKKALKSAQEPGYDMKCVVLSIDTYKGFVKLYEQFGNKVLGLGYACLPHEIYQHFGAGVRIIDEVHQHFHACFKADLYTHVPSAIGLSATLFNRDPTLAEMYRTMYPVQDRYKSPELDKYALVKAVLYNFRNPELIRTSEFGSNMFSNNAVEQSILRRPWVLRNYLELINHCVTDPNGGYLSVKREKKKLLILAYRADMIEKIVAFLKSIYPTLDIRSYVGDSEWENLIEPDITVSTYGSSGTAVDIPNLTNLILTLNIQSDQANVQILGRLRKMPDHDVLMHYLVAENMATSMKYHKAKVALFEERVKSQKTLNSGIYV